MFRDLYPSKKPQQRFKIRKKTTFSHFWRRPLFPASTDPKYPQNFLWALRALRSETRARYQGGFGPRGAREKLFFLQGCTGYIGVCLIFWKFLARFLKTQPYQSNRLNLLKMAKMTKKHWSPIQYLFGKRLFELFKHHLFYWALMEAI